MASNKSAKTVAPPAPKFTPTNLNLPSPPNDDPRMAINNYGQIVGTFGSSGSEQAFLWHPNKQNGTTGKYFDLPTVKGRASFAVDINNKGWVTGYMEDSSGNMAQVLWRTDHDNVPPTQPAIKINNLNNPTPFTPGVFKPYGGINDSGWIASDEYSAGSPRATFFSQTPILELSTCFWAASAMNNYLPHDPLKTVQVVGHFSAACPHYEQPGRWMPDPKNLSGAGNYVTFLNSIDPKWAALRTGAALDVNDAGDAVVAGNLPGWPFSPVIIWKQVKKPGQPGWDYSQCDDLTCGLKKLVSSPTAPSLNFGFGINNHGSVVGTLDTSLAFFYSGRTGKFYDLSKCSGPTISSLNAAHDVNDNGQIVATGVLNKVQVGYLLTPARQRAKR